MRGVIFSAVTSGFLLGANTVALASAGCAALQGSATGGAITGSTSGAGFSAGDVITVSLLAFGAMSDIGLENTTTAAVLLPLTGAIGTRTYTVPANTTAALTVIGGLSDPGASYAWSCVSAAGGTQGSSDSDKLKTVQTTGTTVVANTSAANIGASVNGAIDDAFADDGSSGDSSSSGQSSTVMSREELADYIARRSAKGAGPESGGPSKRVYDYFYREALKYYDAQTAKGQVPVRTSTGYTWVSRSSTASRFAAEPRSAISERTDEAFAALGYAAVTKAPPRVVPIFAPQWSTWVDVRGSGFDQSDSSVLKGTQINATAGVTYKFRPNVVAGLFGGYENFNYDFAALTGKLKGDGGTVGTYVGWQITPTLRWKGMVGWTGLGYDASAGTATGSFDGSRWLFSTGLTGSYRVAAYIIEPSADIFTIWERQTGYIDTLGALHDARSFNSGRVALGGKALAPYIWSAYGVTPYVGFYGDWRFMSDSALPAAVPFAGIGAGWSGRVTGGLSMRVWNKGSLTFGGEYGGLGADYKTWTGNARLTVPF